MKDKVHMQNLERRVEDMLYSHRNERTAYIVHIQHLTEQLIETNKQLIIFIGQQNDEISILRSNNNYYYQKELDR